MEERKIELEGVVLHRSRCSKKNLPTSIVFLELVGCGETLGEVSFLRTVSQILKKMDD
jgi:hypothetical protein